MQIACCSSPRTGPAGGGTGPSIQIQLMHKKRSIKTNGLRDSVIVSTEELDKSTKYAAVVIDILL